MSTRINAHDSPRDVEPLSRTVAPGQRVPITELTGSWPDAMRSWTATVHVYNDRDEYCSAQVAFRRSW